MSNVGATIFFSGDDEDEDIYLRVNDDIPLTGMLAYNRDSHKMGKDYGKTWIMMADGNGKPAVALLDEKRTEPLFSRAPNPTDIVCTYYRRWVVEKRKRFQVTFHFIDSLIRVSVIWIKALNFQ